ncbi:hypothetical protein CHH55_02335 [Niallia circulans]|uniref:hypothetical protein n=1 Tax=Niallia TaxID=2837506 RepID=UPI000BA5CB87|nr:hypothetical protein [Niallia circulans]PAD89791.1 hypothetical protein CHH55_02335 [Niallia circulans]PAE14076.1 hypothetical protein CHI02_01465 [Niallia circulans]
MKLMRHSRGLLVLMMFLSWFFLPLIGKDAVKRFLPAGLFIALIVTIEDIIAKKRKWWWWYEKIHPKLSGIVPFLWGPFFIGSLWILKWTYGKYFRYIFINLVVDSIFVYFLVDWLKKLGIASLVRLKKYQLSLLFFFKSLLLYGFQFVKERKSLKKNSDNTLV